MYQMVLKLHRHGMQYRPGYAISYERHTGESLRLKWKSSLECNKLWTPMDFVLAQKNSINP